MYAGQDQEKDFTTQTYPSSLVQRDSGLARCRKGISKAPKASSIHMPRACVQENLTALESCHGIPADKSIVACKRPKTRKTTCSEMVGYKTYLKVLLVYLLASDFYSSLMVWCSGGMGRKLLYHYRLCGRGPSSWEPGSTCSLKCRSTF